MANTDVPSARGKLPSGMPNPVDLHFGQRLRQRRLLAGMNQGELGKAVGLTPQQIHKYECGDSRAAASLLWNLSRALNCSVSYFFEGMTATTKALSPRRLAFGIDGSAQGEFRTADLRLEREILELSRAYHAITEENARSALLQLVRELGTSAQGHPTSSPDRVPGV